MKCADSYSSWYARTFARHLLWLPWQPWLSLQASSLVGVGFPSPARLAVSFLAIIVSAADTPPNHHHTPPPPPPWRRLRLRVRVCRRLERLLLWCHEFGGVWALCGGYWLLQHSTSYVLDCAFLLLFGVTVATFTWTCLSTRAGWRSTPLFPKWYLTCHGVVQNTVEIPQLQFIVVVLWRRGISPWSGFHSCRTFGGRCSCCAFSPFNIPVVLQRPFPMVRTALRTIKFPQFAGGHGDRRPEVCRSCRFPQVVHIPVVTQRQVSMVLRAMEKFPVARGHGVRRPCFAGGASSTGAVVLSR